MMEKFKQSTAISDDDTGVFTSSTDLFLFYRQTMVNLAKLSTGRPFLDLCKLFGKWLMLYADALNMKIPKYVYCFQQGDRIFERDDKRASAEDVKITCVILNTAEYCQNTAMQVGFGHVIFILEYYSWKRR